LIFFKLVFKGKGEIWVGSNYLPNGLQFIKIEESFLVEIDKYGTNTAESTVIITWATADNKGQTESFCGPLREALLSVLNRAQNQGVFSWQGDLLVFRDGNGRELFKIVEPPNKKSEEVFAILKKASDILKEVEGN